MINVAINGFGRIGRRVFRLIQDREDIQVVAINDLADAKTLSHLLKYDSIHGVSQHQISFAENTIKVGDKSIPLLNHNHPKAIDWSPYKVDYVIESSGKFKTTSDLEFHIKNGAKQVILSVPPIDDDIKTVVLGVNDDEIVGNEPIISNASCTTNNAAPMIAVIDKLCGVKQTYITTVHSYTTDQSYTINLTKTYDVLEQPDNLLCQQPLERQKP